MEQLKHMKDQLVSLVSNQLSHVETTDAKELGEVVDMIKDIAETMYYCTITEAMESKSNKEEEHQRYYIPMRDLDRRYGRMYYDDEMTPKHTEGHYNPTAAMRDVNEGRSPVSRKTYMESKELHQPKEKKMKELDNYMRELSQDITEMIHDASPEEKQLLQSKISTLANKIV